MSPVIESTPASGKVVVAATPNAVALQSASEIPLVFDQISHWYGDVVAVNGINAVVNAGITGLLGPNGAGKTTLLQLAAGLLSPSNGSVRVYGRSPASGPAAYADIGLVPEQEALPGNMSAEAFVSARAALLGLPDVREATRKALATVELDNVKRRKLGGFSKGMKQRAKLAAALVHEPRLVLLDEPFNGLDPRQRVGMMRLLEARAEQGTAVLLSSHILEEIEGLASRILVMLAGRLAATGDYRSLRRLMTDRPHTVHVRTTNDRELAAALITNPTVVGVEVMAEGLSVRATDYAGFARAVGPAAKRLNISVFEIKPADESLEHVFAYLVEK
ncbi:MAG: ABC transporter ATP-binding protein [Phycisphaerae bacterium]|nr:ABC transporter ATP-binding protein [Gemmatimonadaceae bacterium]